MAFSIGRIGLAVVDGGDGITFNEPSSWSADGNVANLSGIQQFTSPADLGWWVDQMLGLGDSIGERVVPVRSTTIKYFDGFFEPLDVSVSVLPGALGTGGHLTAEWSCTLRRIHMWRNARYELISAWGQLTNSHAVTGTLVAATNTFPLDWTAGVPAGGAYTTRSTADGTVPQDVRIVTVATPGTSGTYVGRYLSDPDWHYYGGCRAAYDVTEGVSPTFRHVVGSRSLGFPEVLTYFRIENGLVRFTMPVSSPAMSCQWWDGTQYDAQVSFNLYHIGVSGTFQAVRAAIIVNRPEQVVVRYYGTLNYAGSGNGDGSFPLDVSLRRGHRAVFVRMGRAAQWRLQFGSATACTAITGGLRETSNNAGGNRCVITGSDATTFDTANGRVSQTTAANPFVGAITCEIGGSGATGQNTAQNQLNETYCRVSETQRTVEY
jgi:hypothetical protein